jgi:hypothetical protein
MTERRWTPEEEAELARLWNRTLLYCDEIAQRLDRPEGSLRGKLAAMRREGIKLVDRQSRSRFRGRMSVPKHAHPAVRKLFAEMNRQRTTIDEVAERSGLSTAGISEWRYRRMPKIDTLEAALNVLGFELCVREA